MKNFKGIVFDLDGTLIDSQPDIAAAANKALAAFDLPVLTIEDYKNKIGWGLKRTMELALPFPAGEKPELFEQLYLRLLDEYHKNPASETIIYPGIEKVLQNLSEKKIPMAVWTNKNEELTGIILRKLFPEISFNCLVGQFDDRPRKPDPAGSAVILEKLKLQREDILYIGDTSIDMETAVNSRFYPLGVDWGYRTRKELEEAGAAGIISRPEQILNYV